MNEVHRVQATLRVMNVDQGADIDGFAVAKLGTGGEMALVLRQRIVAIFPPHQLIVTPSALHHVIGTY